MILIVIILSYYLELIKLLLENKVLYLLLQMYDRNNIICRTSQHKINFRINQCHIKSTPKIIEYLNGTAISTAFVLRLLELLLIFSLSLNYSVWFISLVLSKSSTCFRVVNATLQRIIIDISKSRSLTLTTFYYIFYLYNQ